MSIKSARQEWRQIHGPRTPPDPPIVEPGPICSFLLHAALLSAESVFYNFNDSVQRRRSRPLERRVGHHHSQNASKVVGLEPRVLCDARQHARADLVAIVKCEDEIKPALTK
jgi:hypothetical protein